MAALSVIRVSGPRAIAAVQQLFTGKDLLRVPSHTIHYGYLKEDNEILDEVMVSVFLAPRSFTTEDSVEISCHGSPHIVQRIMQALHRVGVRMAEPGEFTRRAFLNGRINLGQAEAVADLIASESDRQRQLALAQMRGGYLAKLQLMRQELIDLAALLELELDFGEEDVEFAQRETLRNLMTNLRDYAQKLSNSFQLGNAIREGVPVAIVGPPNAGKSTLLNALLQEEKAIVTDIPGTTRDTVEDLFRYRGVLYRFIDTAGIRHTSDRVEQMGIERSKAAAEKARMVLLLFDDSTTQEELVALEAVAKAGKAEMIWVKNKCDIPSPHGVEVPDCLHISAREGIGLDDLLLRMARSFSDQNSDAGETVSNIRHAESLTEAVQALNTCLEGLQNRTYTEMLAFELRNALDALGKITGQVSNEEVLGSVFSRFCIGK